MDGTATSPDNNLENEKSISANLDRLRLAPRLSRAAILERKSTIIGRGRPDTQEHFRVHPDESWRLDTFVIDIKADREIYLVVSELWELFPKECKPVTIFPTIDRREVVKLWPVKLPDELGRLDDWNRSAHAAADLATTSWVRMTSNQALGAYEVDVAHATFPDPVWPTKSFEDLIDLAFKGRYIEHEDHPVLRRLRGEI